MISHKGRRVLADLRKVPTTAAERKLHFAMLCVAKVFPRKDPMYKQSIFEEAARWGTAQTDCPRALRGITKLANFIGNRWSEIRRLLPRYHNITPCYVADGAFGLYINGNARDAQKQLDHDEKIALGVVKATDSFSKAVAEQRPQVAGKTYQLKREPIVLKSFSDLKGKI